jgi:hypothetical protein
LDETRPGRLSREHRWKLIHDAQGLKTGGLSNSAIVAALLKENPGRTKHCMQRIVAAMYADFDRDAKRRHKSQLGSTLAGIDRAKRMAITKQKFLVVEGSVEQVNDPDNRGYLDAVKAEAVLFGSTDRNVIELLHKRDDQIATIYEAIREVITDENIKRYSAKDLRLMTYSVIERALDPDAPQGLVEVDATVVAPKQIGPATNGYLGTNGTHADPAPPTEE